MVQTFSIVTVCFNDAEALVPTIRSIVEQSNCEFQYVIQDGGSSDDTAAVVKSFGDWVDVFISEPDHGIYPAMNRAVQRCTGKYTLFINAADMLAAPTVLSEVEAQLIDADDIVTGQSIAFETGKVHPFRPPERFWTGMTFDHQAAFVRTDLLNKFPFDESLRISSDFDFFSRMRLQRVSFRSIETAICRKPYTVGASSSFIVRFRERYGVTMRHFGEQYPVHETLHGELVQYITKFFNAPHLKTKMEAMTIEGLLALHDELDALTGVRSARA